MYTPMVSVILPVYNVEKYLFKCLSTITNQTLKDIEIICIDDGSTDQSLSILKSFAAKDQRIIVLEQRNLGAGVARNRGLDIAKGRYLSFLDSDDFFETNMLEKAVQACELHNAEISFFKINSYDELTKQSIDNTWVVKEKLLPKKNPFNISDAGDYLFTSVHTCAWNKLFRSSFVKQNHLKFQELRNTNDLYFVCMALALANKIVYIPEVLMSYRINVPTSLSQGANRTKHPDDAHSAFSLLYKSLLQKDKIKLLERAYVNMCLGVYYYNFQKLKSSDQLSYLIKLVTKWLPELNLDRFDEKFYFYPHLFKFKQDLLGLDLFSFDIFDTLLTRKTFLPKDIFLVMENILQQDKLYDDVPCSLRQNFQEVRMRTERFMYSKVCNSEKKDITIEEIYSLIGTNYDLSDKQITKLVDLEIKTEKSNLIPIEKNITCLEKLVGLGKKVILISDMYLSEKIIRSFLLPFSKVFSDIDIYVSNELQAKKYTGEMYLTLQKKLGVSYDKWMHFGDNLRSDIDQAKKLGIKVCQFIVPKPSIYEAQLLQKYPKDCEISYIVGSTRNVSLNFDLSMPAYLGVHFASPILYAYVNYVLEQSILKKIEKLYFIARDGYILKKIADVIIQSRSLNISTFYLYGSRLSWRDAYSSNDEQRINKIANYIRENVDFSSNLAFVEYAGTGVTMDCLSNIIHEHALGTFKGTFYLYHSRDCSKQSSPKFSFTYLNEDFNPVIELLVRAPHGQTLGYTETKDGQTIPKLEEKEGERLVSIGYNEFISGILQYVAFVEKYGKLTPSLHLIHMYIKYLTSAQVCDDIVNFFGKVPFVLDGAITEVMEYAPVLSKEEIEIAENDKNQKITQNVFWSKKRSKLNESEDTKEDSLKSVIKKSDQKKDLGLVSEMLRRNVFQKTFLYYKKYGLRATIKKIKRVLL